MTSHVTSFTPHGRPARRLTVSCSCGWQMTLGKGEKYRASRVAAVHVVAQDRSRWPDSGVTDVEIEETVRYLSPYRRRAVGNE